MTVRDCRILNVPKIGSLMGNLSFIESGRPIPFAIRRTYWIYDVPGGEDRGGHAFRSLKEFVVALSGSFDLTLDDGMQTRVVTLNRSYFGLYIPNLIWRRLENFSTNAVAMILASEKYSEADYLFDYSEFLKVKGEVGV
ncbi:MAG: hypothetical protein COB53_13120 [Elusimicrobia bacterium]|nr:MAG: hypothetical protein COB53_13120 [Elusimicrobiota bacterium]